MKRLLHRTRSILIAPAILAMGILVIGVPLDLQSQWIFAALAIAGAMWFAIRNSRRSLLTLGFLVLMVSSRYMFWRTTQTLEFESASGFLLGMGLYLAELYAYVILLLGLLQTSWPLERPVIEASGEPQSWPIVDVFIPTYHESLAIVRTTVLAAMDMDYPPERFRVYILDDGRRSEFQAFARQVGCGYLTRAGNKHAKAGNLNAAMRRTSGDLVAVFDCDHVPTRAFLQMTVGWFQKDPKLALVQTPHHFYSPDPVQRNLITTEDLPGEGDLFYGPIQKGNDLWNAAFFCGSCAVIRRSALDQTNGFAGETVTEDAHTALKLQRMGWNTAYIGVRLSAGLATERLALHIGQRVRWARGMTQILRTDNPLWGRGLSLPQRLCYLNAMLHFQFPLPRIVFLTSPLAYLLFGENIIRASASMIFAYAVPHLYCAMVSGTRIHGRDRRPFWSEIYETLIAFHLVKPTIVTLFSPRQGKFNVTDKGGRLDRSYFDIRTVRPHLICAGLVIAGMIVGAIKLIFFPHLFNIQADTFYLNLAWASFSLLILTASISVARESRQARDHVRIPARLPVTIYFANGHIVDATTEDISMAGLAARLPQDFFMDVSEWRVSHVGLDMGDDFLTLPADHLRLREGRIVVRFRELDILQERQLVRAVMGRADAWTVSRERQRVSAAKALWDILLIDLRTLGRLLRLDRKERTEGRRAIAEDGTERPVIETAAGQSAPAPRRSGHVQMSVARTVWLMALLPALLGAGSALAQDTQAPGIGRLPIDATVSNGGYSPGGSARRVLTLKTLRVGTPIRLEGVRGEIGIPFGMREDEVVTQASISLNVAWSPAMLGDLSQLVILLNDEVVQIVRLVPNNGERQTITFPVHPALLLPGDNRLNLRLVGHYTRDCEDPFHSSLWANISNIRSFLDLTVQKLPFAPDLARLPRPFFDANQNEPLRLPFVFAKAPGNAEIEAAASIASWFGREASYRGFDFVPIYGAIPKGNAIVFLKRGQSLPGLTVNVGGAAAMVIRNPADEYSQLLIIMGRDDREIKLAAAAIGSGRNAFSGSVAALGSARVPAYRAYGAPRWLRTDRPVQLGELVSPAALQGVGVTPGPLTVQFRAAPDLFFWPRDGGVLDVHYRYPAAPWLDRRASRLDVSMNGQFEKTLPLGQASWWDAIFDRASVSSIDGNGKVTLPRYDLYGQNEIVFDYQLVLANKKKCEGTIPRSVRMSILPTSTIDLTDSYHALQKPDLASFANAGFPFTIYPDLSETVALLSPDPSADELRAFLILMGRFGDSTGAAVTRIEVVRSAAASELAGKDVIVVGSSDLVRGSALFKGAPISGGSDGILIQQSSLIERAWAAVSPFPSSQDEAAAFMARVDDFQGMVEFESPLERGRTVTAILAAEPALLPILVMNMADQRFNSQIQGDLSVFNGEGMTSFAVGPTYWVGSLPGWVRIAYWFSDKPLLLAIGGLLVAILLTGPTYLLLRRQSRRRLSGSERE